MYFHGKLKQISVICYIYSKTKAPVYSNDIAKYSAMYSYYTEKRERECVCDRESF